MHITNVQHMKIQCLRTTGVKFVQAVNGLLVELQKRHTIWHSNIQTSRMCRVPLVTYFSVFLFVCLYCCAFVVRAQNCFLGWIERLHCVWIFFLCILRIDCIIIEVLYQSFDSSLEGFGWSVKSLNSGTKS